MTAIEEQGSAPAEDAANPRHRGKGHHEEILQNLIMLAIGTAAGAGSFKHVHDVAASHGQVGWLAWADAVVLELMSIASGLELRRRKRLHAPVFFPSTVMAVSVLLSLGAQVVAAEPSALGWIAAAIPAAGFLVMVKIALARTSHDPARNASRLALVAPDEVAIKQGNQPECGSGEETVLAGDADPAVAVLIPAARDAAGTLLASGQRVTRSALAEALRSGGVGLSNERASSLLRQLQAELVDSKRTQSSPTTSLKASEQ